MSYLNQMYEKKAMARAWAYAWQASTVWIVEASHVYAHARAIAFFSYIWFKYDILSLHCYKLRSVVIIMLSYQAFAAEFNSRLGSECVMQYAGTGKEMHEAIFFLLQNLALQLGLGQGCQPEG